MVIFLPRSRILKTSIKQTFQNPSQSSVQLVSNEPAFSSSMVGFLLDKNINYEIEVFAL